MPPVLPAPPVVPGQPGRLTRLATYAALPAASALRTGFDLLARARGGKPLHPRGTVTTGRLVVDAAPSGARPSGVPLLDRPGTHPVLVRTSRSIGLPAPWPDVQGLALRLPQDDEAGVADLLFASTGRGVVSRHVFVPRATLAAPLTTLLPLTTPTGRLLMMLEPRTPAGGTATTDAPTSWWFLTSAPGGRWVRRGRLEVERPAGSTDGSGRDGEGDEPVHFDPVRHRLRGTRHPLPLAVLRGGSYGPARTHLLP